MNEDRVLFRVNDAEEMGYRFEKGRQRAQSEHDSRQPVWDSEIEGTYRQSDSGAFRMNGGRGEWMQGPENMIQRQGRQPDVPPRSGYRQDAYMPFGNVSEKDRKTALILCIFLGVFGVHHFYLGNIKKGILYLFTYGLFFIGWIIDIISLATGSFRDRYGRPVVDLDKYSTPGGQFGGAYDYSQMNPYPGSRGGNGYGNAQMCGWQGMSADPVEIRNRNNATKRRVFFVLAVIGMIGVLGALGDGEFSAVLGSLIWSGIFGWLWYNTPKPEM